jgi:hypothetical protein
MTKNLSTKTKEFKLSGYQKLKTELKEIAEKGIQVDSKHLKRDMCAQFADPHEWIREYVVNAYDAKARRCWISACREDHGVTISVEDDGHGMNRESLHDFATIYRSIKSEDSHQCIGSHGIGKLSVSAIPGQRSFLMITSTGEETWRLKAGCLLDDEPMYIEKVEPPQPRGTRFEITFDSSKPIEKLLEKYKNVLFRYVRFLPIQIILFELKGRNSKNPDAAEVIYSSNGSVEYESEHFERSFSFRLGRVTYRVAMAVGSPVHEIYQNSVMVSDRYNLFFHDRKEKPRIPHISVRADSPDFELPFGRHRLNNEEILGPLSRHLRGALLPQYLKELFSIYEEGLLRQYEISPSVVQEVACALMATDANSKRPWCQIPVFAVRNGPRVSLYELEKIQRNRGVLYLEGENDRGTDYSAFDAPVLSLHQPNGAFEVLRARFDDTLISLDSEDIVLESSMGGSLDSSEKRFASFLGFHPEVLRMNWMNQRCQDKSGFLDSFCVSKVEVEQLKGAREELQRAEKDLASIEWRVNHLVNMDGKSPCVNRLFLYRNGAVVLNLHHPTIKALVRVSEFAPALAGHWALAMCLSNRLKILPHLTDQAREDLILMDAMAKCGMKSLPLRNEYRLKTEKDTKRWQDFLREIEGEMSLGGQ